MKIHLNATFCVISVLLCTNFNAKKEWCLAMQIVIDHLVHYIRNDVWLHSMSCILVVHLELPVY